MAAQLLRDRNVFDLLSQNSGQAEKCPHYELLVETRLFRREDVTGVRILHSASDSESLT